MSLSSAVQWWEEWQLRVLVLSSLFVQWLLFFSASMRKLPIPSLYRYGIWMSYLGSDALAIYALATLFNRQGRQDCSSGQGTSILEVVWAPVLLIHLGGQDLITAYNIEDNELWTRHIFTSVSQVTVAIYVFCKSWPGGDMRLLLASICLFVVGILKCVEKPQALRSASINSLVSSSGPAPRRNTDGEGGINSLEDYVKKARAFVQTNPRHQAQEGDVVDLEPGNHLPQAQGEDAAMAVEADYQPRAHGEATTVDIQPDHHPLASSTWRSCLNQITSRYNKSMEEIQRRVDDYDMTLEVYKLFLDLASSYHDRLAILEFIWVRDGNQAYGLLQNRLSGAFDLLYTKRKMFSLMEKRRKENSIFWVFLSDCVRVSAAFLPWAAISLFHKSHKDAYNANDVKVTYALLCCTAVLEICSSCMTMRDQGYAGSDQGEASSGSGVAKYKQARRKVVLHLRVIVIWFQRPPIMDWLANLLRALRQFSSKALLNSFVGQYNLVWFFACYKRHSSCKMLIGELFHCKDFIDQYWGSMAPCNSTVAITELVLEYAKKGWEDQIKDADSYCKFNDRRGWGTLQVNKCDQDLGCSLRRPFDESVLLWHIATDFCFYHIGASTDHQCATAQCIQDASGEGHGCAVWCERSPHHKRAVQCREISNYMMYLLFINPEMLLPGSRRNLFTTANVDLEEILKDDNPSLKKILKDGPSLIEILGRKDSNYRNILKIWSDAKMKWREEINRGLVQTVISKVQSTERREVVACTKLSPNAETISKMHPTECIELSSDAEILAKVQPTECRELSPGVETYATTQGFIIDAWKLAEALLDFGDEKKMWEVIEGVWVEMLCFSASRCRGYLHAKSLGTGGELLTYIWLLLSHMGMETLPERLQRAEFSSEEGNAGASSSTSQTSGGEDPPPFRHSSPHEAAADGGGASTSRPQEIVPAE
ncbi:hypothetical protein CFC21_079229 [Triticum aestivum]|uniref:DUF4220 domain-containing protein n=2 Tax=Triticum aestivum TaxID=4565 RepID=A0A9R1L1M7_WHEAT|nr:uncharacterized protein LOC123120882 [Triticum aestivum]KAF7074345.1 hypothetical protein CFC21_079229 [Triticum aestivum]